MEKDDLKLLWKELHSGNSSIDETEIKKIMNMKHSKRISEILFGRKKEMFAYSTVFLTFILLMIYAFMILGIDFSFFSTFLFSFIGMFLFFKTTHSISTFVILSKESKSTSVCESIISFSKVLKKIQIIDFVMNVLFFYILATILIITLYNEIEVINNLNLFVPVISIILVLIFIPWLIKRLHRKIYKGFYITLKNSLQDIEEAY